MAFGFENDVASAMDAKRKATPMPSERMCCRKDIRAEGECTDVGRASFQQMPLSPRDHATQPLSAVVTSIVE